MYDYILNGNDKSEFIALFSSIILHFEPYGATSCDNKNQEKGDCGKMAFSEKFIRKQLNIFKPFVVNSSLEVVRKGQDALGELMTVVHKKQIKIEYHVFENFKGAWIKPLEKNRQGVILYLHGGGYTCGSLEYAKGFGAVLASQCAVDVFCAAYRLAPEHKYPAALDDAFSAYMYLLREGYTGKQIVLCGESAGGGLCWALCLKLRQAGLQLPCGIIGISPWTDLTSSGASYEVNKDVDPSMTVERLQFFADCYTDDKSNELVSPLFGDLKGMPPSLIFVGGDEIMLDDAKNMHEKLLASGCRSSLKITPGMWHAYVLYGVKEHDAEDFNLINEFLNRNLTGKRKLRWMRLDNAAKIFPAAKRRHWNNVFRLSVTLNAKIDVDVLQSALDVTVRRFPSIAVRLRRGMFWYYIEEIESAPLVKKDVSHPLERMPFDDIRRCAFRVLYYENRIAVEFFHALTDGNGGLIFLKTLTAEYLLQKYNAQIPDTDGVWDRLEEPDESEFEDSFIKNAGDVCLKRQDRKAYRVTGIPEKDGYLHVTTGTLSVDDVSSISKSYDASITAFLTAVMIASIIEIQSEKVKNKKKFKPVSVQIPVNLRKFFQSKTVRNFVMVANIGVDPKMGEYTFDEIIRIVKYQMGLDITKKNMQAAFTTNVKTEKNIFLKIVPLFIKNIAMKAVFNNVGESTACLSLSNLGDTKLPDAMDKYVNRFDFVIGAQAAAPYNCGVISYKGKLNISIVRNTVEPELERHFFTYLRRMGLNVRIESNQR